MKLLGSTPRTARSLLRNNRCVALTAQRFHSRKLNARDEEKNPKGFSPVYVHHVSKIALEHMQEKRADWLVEQGLDRGLHINPNGTFMMSFPARKGFDSGRLWTSYDSARKQHWLSVYRQKLALRFLLKDTSRLEPTKILDSTIIEERINAAVDQMIAAINQCENKSAP